MADPFTEAWAEANASVPINKVFLDCLEFLHPGFLDENGDVTSICVVRDTQDHDLLLEANAPLNPSTVVKFIAIPFDMPAPEVADSQTPAITIKVDNIGREILEHLDAAIQLRAELQVRVRCYIYDTITRETEQGIEPFTFVMQAITVTDSSVEGSASPADLVNLQFARLSYDLVTYPGLNQ